MSNIHDKYAQRHYEAAMDLFEEGSYKKALAQINQAIKKAPTNPDYYSMKGVFLHKMNDIIGAIEAYIEAVNVDNKHAFSHYNLGLIYMKQNKVVQAVNEWKAVIKVKPNDIDSIFNIGVALSHLGKKLEAISFYKKVLQINPEHVQAHQNLGVIYRDEGNFKLAKLHFKKLSEYDSTYIEIVGEEILKCEEQEFLIKIAENQTKFKESELVSHGDELDVSTALFALIEGDYDNALSICEQILSKNPLDIQALLVKGQCLTGLSRNSDAIATFTEILEKAPKTEDALFHLGNIFLDLGELEKALSFFVKLNQTNPAYPFLKENIQSIKSKLSIVENE